MFSFEIEKPFSFVFCLNFSIEVKSKSEFIIRISIYPKNEIKL